MLKIGDKVFYLYINGFSEAVIEEVEVYSIEQFIAWTKLGETASKYKGNQAQLIGWLNENKKLCLAEGYFITKKEAEKELNNFLEEEIEKVKKTIKYHKERLKNLQSQIKGK